eukprot:CAMPEP_0114166088 /NCGR_PEP_ID=MMETSP0043_2-20121206/31635_1 /TAXON_ID=464988 /ORGANISM="Hemiselmis andersenii, Strain CCMP644" /LENGTH=59 /DNA_ID=CAMNT_0001263033 /DNA_START=14 /DNA_END=189 /DNA_ORIENTATION=+
MGVGAGRCLRISSSSFKYASTPSATLPVSLPARMSFWPTHTTTQSALGISPTAYCSEPA